jgi:hypothetical protein
MFEIASSKLALQRSQMPATRSYAEHMIADHSATSSRFHGVCRFGYRARLESLCFGDFAALLNHRNAIDTMK